MKKADLPGPGSLTGPSWKWKLFPRPHHLNTGDTPRVGWGLREITFNLRAGAVPTGNSLGGKGVLGRGPWTEQGDQGGLARNRERLWPQEQL